MFRAIYTAASAIVKVTGVDGKQSASEPFPIRRGVLQGDITSPIYFVLALEAILRKHDKHPLAEAFDSADTSSTLSATLMTRRF